MYLCFVKVNKSWFHLYVCLNRLVLLQICLDSCTFYSTVTLELHFTVAVLCVYANDLLLCLNYHLVSPHFHLIQGAGTTESTLTEIFASRSNRQIKALSEAYLAGLYLQHKVFVISPFIW